MLLPLLGCPLLLSLVPVMSLEAATEGNVFRIHNESEFIDFSESVNNKTNYSGTTVFLDADIDLSEEPQRELGYIGYYKSYFNKTYFRGTFDGQGHTISNLAMNSSSMAVGLFGYSDGMIIKNVVMDNSCSIVNVHSSNDTSAYTYTGGIVGWCEARNKPCVIESCVYMGRITLNKNTENYMSHIGGVAGRVYSVNHDSVIKNCANYGSVTNLGKNTILFLGGIVGYSEGYSKTTKVSIQNCLGNGVIATSGTTSSSLYMGGITGGSIYTNINHCVGAGNIRYSESSRKEYIGGISGYVYYSVYISYCYWDKDISYYAYGDIINSELSEGAYFSAKYILNKIVKIGNYTGNSLIKALNAFPDSHPLYNYHRWLLNNGGNDVSFTINEERSPFALNHKIVLLPDLANEGNLYFDGWYIDNTYLTQFTEDEINKTTRLYGRWEENNKYYTITFDTRGGTPIESITSQYLSTVSLPTIVGNSTHAFASWGTEYGDRVPWNFTVPAYNITLYPILLQNRIANIEEFIKFTNNVNSGANYSGVTVFLDSDLDFSGELFVKFEQIGINDINTFQGIFDGQGHMISGLSLKSNSAYTGLFGHSYGATIRNVVVGDTCSIENSYAGPSSVYVGTIIGRCRATSEPCNIENIVNMGNISFGGDTTNILFLGGICGYVGSSDFGSVIKNCANYGAVTHSKKTYDAYIGGIVGSYLFTSTKISFIQNCLNYGEVAYYGKTWNSLSVGGITGGCSHATIENCVSAGLVTFNTNRGSNAGAIVGSVARDSSASIKHSFWTNKVRLNTVAGGQIAPTIDSETSQVSLNLGVMGKLNTYSSINSWNKWLLNTNNTRISITINNEKGFTIGSQVVLLPDPVDNSERTFSGWFTDEALTSILNSSEVESETSLYGIFCGSNYSVSFDVNGGDEPITEKAVIECNGTYGELPIPTRTEHRFLGWFTERKGGTKAEPGGRPVLKNHTLHAYWAVNSYTIIFDFNDGTKPEVRILYYGQKIEYPKPTKKIGYTFGGWLPNPEVMPGRNLTILAQWTTNNYILTFDFDNGTNPERIILGYDSPIEYPPDPVKEGHTFYGWNNSVISMPPCNLTIKAIWVTATITVFFERNKIEIPYLMERIRWIIKPMDARIEIEEDEFAVCTIQFFDKVDDYATHHIIEVLMLDRELGTAIDHIEVNGEKWVIDDDDDNGGIKIAVVVVVVVVTLIIVGFLTAFGVFLIIKNRPKDDNLRLIGVESTVIND